MKTTYLIIISIQTILVCCFISFWIIGIPISIALIPLGAITFVEVILVVAKRVITLNKIKRK